MRLFSLVASFTLAKKLGEETTGEGADKQGINHNEKNVRSQGQESKAGYGKIS